MFVHNLSPTFIDLGFFEIKWYSIAYILGILIGWFWGKKIIFILEKKKINLIKGAIFDNLITTLIVSIILGGRVGYVIFYNLEYYFANPLSIFKIWEGGMSFHGGLIGIILGVFWFAKKNNLNFLNLTDIISCVAPIGLFLGRIANFINGELYGKTTNLIWGVIFPKIDNLTRHPSQLYEAFFEGIILFIILNYFILKKNYIKGFVSSLFLVFYGCFRIFSEFFREPDVQIGYILNFLSMGSILSIIMILFGLIILVKIKKTNHVN